MLAWNESVGVLEFTTYFDGILKSKWRLLDEVDCLPHAAETIREFQKQSINFFEKSRSVLAKNDPLADAIFLFWDKPSSLSLCIATEKEGAKPIAEWQLLFSQIQPNAVKGIELIFPKLTSDISFGQLLESAEHVLAGDKFSKEVPAKIWKTLPMSEKWKAEMWVCPHCLERGSMRPALFEFFNPTHHYYAVLCDQCDFSGPEQPAKSDAIEAFISGYGRLFSNQRREESTRLAIQEQLQAMQAAMNRIVAISQDRKFRVTEQMKADVQSEFKKILEMGAENISVYEQRRKKK